MQLNESDEYVTVRFDGMDVDDLEDAKRRIRRALRAGIDLWTGAQRDPSKFVGGESHAVVTFDKYADRTYLSEEVTTTIAGTIGRELPS